MATRRAMSPVQLRHLPPRERGSVTARIVALSLCGLDTVTPYLQLNLEQEGAQITVYADRGLYPGVLRQLRLGVTVTAVVRARDHLLHRLAVEDLTVHDTVPGVP